MARLVARLVRAFVCPLTATFKEPAHIQMSDRPHDDPEAEGTTRTGCRICSPNGRHVALRASIRAFYFGKDGAHAEPKRGGPARCCFTLIYRRTTRPRWRSGAAASAEVTAMLHDLHRVATVRSAALDLRHARRELSALHDQLADAADAFIFDGSVVL